MTLPEQQVLLDVPERGATSPVDNSSSKSNGPAVVLRGLHKSFGSQVVLNGVNLTMKSGDTLAILGRSGTGKSVLLKLIIGLQQPDSGSILVQGQEITGLDMEAMNEIRKTMGFLFQSAALYDSLTVEQNIAFPLKRHTEMTKSERRDRVKELLGSVGMVTSRKSPAIFRAACRSASGSLEHWLSNRASCCSMNPRQDSILLPPARSTS
jgi:ABC-type glutathione transport system ATPase component